MRHHPKSFSAFGFGASEGSTLTSQSSRRGSQINVNVAPSQPMSEALSDTPEIRKYKKKFSSDILCAALWGTYTDFDFLKVKSEWLNLIIILKDCVQFHSKSQYYEFVVQRNV